MFWFYLFQRAQLGCGYNTTGGNQGLTNTTFGGKSGTVPGHHSGPPGMTGNYASGAPTQYHHRATTGWNSAPLPAQQYRYGTGPVTQTTMSPYTSYNPNPTTVSIFRLVVLIHFLFCRTQNSLIQTLITIIMETIFVIL